jgi:hypothetical protein
VEAVVVSGGDDAGAACVRVTLAPDGDDAAAAAPLAAFKLAWHPALRVITAAPLPGPAAAATAAALAAAFPDDDGTRLPSEAAVQVAGGVAEWKGDEAQGRPYRWAQALAGLDLAPPADAAGLPPPGVLAALRSQTRAYTALRALREAAGGHAAGAARGGDEEMEDGEAA